MYAAQDLARQRRSEVLQDAERTAIARRLVAARRWQRRAAASAARARRASAAIR